MGRMTRNNLRRFVIQRHERQGEGVHWDLMLESGDCLETYRVNQPPEEWGDKPMEAVKIVDHPLKFLTYEGVVNKDKGKVTIVDSGIYRILSQKEHRLSVDFTGKIIKGKKEVIFEAGGGRVRRGR